MHRRRFLAASGTLLTTLSAGCQGVAPPREPPSTLGTTDTAWPMFRRTLNNSGNLGGPSPMATAPELRWTFETGADCGQECQRRGGDAIWGSPTVRDGTVYVGSYDGHLYAVDAVSGTLEWRFAAGDIVDSTPAIGPDRLYFGSWDGNVYALDAATGEEVWAYETDAIVRGSPKVHDGRVFVGTHCGIRECEAYTDRASSGAGSFLALDADSGELEWSFSAEGNVVSSPAIVDRTVYVTTWGGSVYAFEEATGEEVWSREYFQGISSSPAVADGSVFFTQNAGVFSVDAETGAENWTVKRAVGTLPASPAIGRSRVFVAGGYPEQYGRLTGTILAFSRDGGTTEWEASVPAHVVGSSPAIQGRTIYLGAHNLESVPRHRDSAPGLYAFDLDGELRWRDTERNRWGINQDAGIGSSPALAEGGLFVGGVDGTLYAYS
jgi:outer membrane protein assembly factor BamB